MNAGGASELGEMGNTSLDFGLGDHHEIGQLVDEADDVRQFIEIDENLLLKVYYHNVFYLIPC